MQRNSINYAFLCILVSLPELGKKKKISLAASCEVREAVLQTEFRSSTLNL